MWSSMGIMYFPLRNLQVTYRCIFKMALVRTQFEAASASTQFFLFEDRLQCCAVFDASLVPRLCCFMPLVLPRRFAEFVDGTWLDALTRTFLKGRLLDRSTEFEQAVHHSRDGRLGRSLTMTSARPSAPLVLRKRFRTNSVVVGTESSTISAAVNSFDPVANS